MTQEDRIKHNLSVLGFDTKNIPINTCVEQLIEQHLILMSEIEHDNKEFFKRELKRIITQPTN